MEKPESETSSEGSEFIATDEMLNFAYDDESTINEEEDEGEVDEIDNLKAESDMPLEELLKLYGHSTNESDDTDRYIKEIISNSENEISTNLENNDDDGDEDNGNCNLSQRNSSRLWCKDLIESSSNYDSDDDGDYIPLVDSKHFANAKTRIGDDYQSKVPNIETQQSNEYYSSRSYETLLWKALSDGENHSFNTNDSFNENLTDYLENYGKISGISMLSRGEKDDATALYNLMEKDYDVKESLSFARNRPVQPCEFPNIMESWTEQECLQFEKGFETHNKNFHLIREQRLKTRSVSEIVEFYYFWKKTHRYEDFIRLCKKDKKKSTSQITDYADCLIPNLNGSRREKYLLGNWRGVKPGDDNCTTDEGQTAAEINRLLGCNGNDSRHILEGTWNITAVGSLTNKIPDGILATNEKPNNENKTSKTYIPPNNSPSVS